MSLDFAQIAPKGEAHRVAAGAVNPQPRPLRTTLPTAPNSTSLRRKRMVAEDANRPVHVGNDGMTIIHGEAQRVDWPPHGPGAMTAPDQGIQPHIAVIQRHQ